MLLIAVLLPCSVAVCMESEAPTVDVHILRQGDDVQLQPCVHASRGQRFELRLLVKKQGPGGHTSTRQTQIITVNDVPTCAGMVRNRLHRGDRLEYELELWQDEVLVYKTHEHIDA